MGWLSWATLWWIALGVAIAIATRSSEGWGRWWLRVAALLLSLATLDQLGGGTRPMSRLVAASPAWVQQVAVSLDAVCNGVGSTAGFVCDETVPAGLPAARETARR